MQITIVDATVKPLMDISIAAGTSYSKDDYSEKRILHCFKNHHMSVFEFAWFQAHVEGISRSCSHQLVRHRLASFCQLSQRYTKIEGDDWYVIPPEIASDDELNGIYRMNMAQSLLDYNHALNRGIKPEDARFLLPEATKTNISVAMNARELFHFLDERLNSHAQWEIRELAAGLMDALATFNDQWYRLLRLYRTGEM